MDNEFSHQKDLYFEAQKRSVQRREKIKKAIRTELHKYLSEFKDIEIRASDIGEDELALVLFRAPILLKALISTCNIAQRAIKRDLGFDVKTYGTTLKMNRATQLAKYIKPFLPKTITLESLLLVDHVYFIDNEMRQIKGSEWEKRVIETLRRISGRDFRKRKFNSNHYEIDAALASRGIIIVGVDIKRIESPRDIHKRSDEIINKAVHLKRTFPDAKFFAMIYFPFPKEQDKIEERFAESQVDGIVYVRASDVSIRNSCEELVKIAKIKRGPVDESLEDYT